MWEGQARACGLGKHVAGEVANSNSDLEVKLPGLPEALIGIGGKREIRGMKPGVGPDLH